MENDDLPVGRVLSRREAVRLLAIGGGVILTGCSRGDGALVDNAGATTSGGSSVAGSTAATGTMSAVPGCVVKPELTVGPYFVDRQLDRTDIRVEPSTGKAVEGVPLVLAFNVSQISDGKCQPLGGAMVDVWHCDASGNYSAVTDRMAGVDLASQKFLRGYQVTDNSGKAQFTTIYPGWYPGRTVHIHFKVRAPAAAALAGKDSETYDFTSQLFFDEAVSDRIYSQAPYSAKGRRDTTNARDGIFRGSGGQLLLALAEADNGYRSSFDIGLDLSDSAVGGADRSGGRGGPRPRRGT